MKKFMIRSLILALTVVFYLAVNAYGEEGVTDTEIHIGQWGPQTGPVAAWGSVARGTDALFKMINAEGGIHGRKIVYHYFDDGYNPAKTKAGVKELQESRHSIFAWVGGVGSSTGMAVKDYLSERGVPWVGPAAGSMAWLEPPLENLFLVYPLYISEAMTLTKYAVENLDLKKIAMVYQNDEYGKNGVMGLERQLAKYGLKPALTIPLNLGDTDVKPHVAALKKSGADTVLMWVGPGAVARLMLTSQAMKFSPQWMSTSTCSDFPLMFKITRGLFKGAIVGSFGALPDSSDPLTTKYKKDAYEKYAAEKERWGTFYIAGLGFAEPLVEGLKRAGRNLTRESFIEAMESIQNFKGIMGEVNYKKFNPYNPWSRQGTDTVFIIQCGERGKAIYLTNWIKPDFNFEE